MAFVGMKYAVFAPIKEETYGAAITYGTGAILGKMIGANVNWTRNSNPLYADDALAEDENSITGGTLSMTLDDITDEVQAEAMGLVKSGEADQEVYEDTGDAGRNVGVGYLRVRRKDGKTSYVAYWIHKTLLGITSESASTKGETITWQTPTAEGKIMGVVIDDSGKTKFRAHRTFAAEKEAMDWLNAKANIQTAAA